MAAVIPPVLLPGSPFPDVPRYGLFTVVPPRDLPSDKAGAGGIEYQTPVAVLPYGYAVACPTPDNLTLTDQLDTNVSLPFVVVSDTLCGTLGHSEAEWQDYVLRRLYMGEQAIVENMFSLGLNEMAPSLSNNTPNVTTLTAVTTISAAIDALEGWLYERYGPRGVLHIPISANSSVWSDFHILRDTDNILYTPMGTQVVFGNYAGDAPDGTEPDDGHSTFYITGQMAIWRASSPFVSPYGASIDKSTNQIRMFAEREYVLTYETFCAGIDVTISGEP